MQSCPNEASVLRKYFQFAPATTDSLGKYFDRFGGLFARTHPSNDFVYHYVIIRIDPGVQCSNNKHSITFFELNIPCSQHTELSKDYKNSEHDNENTVVIFIYDVHNKVWQSRDCTSVTDGSIIWKKFYLQLIYLCMTHVKCYLLYKCWIDYYVNLYLYLLKITIIITATLIGKVCIKFQTSEILNGSYINSDMEVDATSNELDGNLKNQIIKEEVLDIGYDFQQCEKDGAYSVVIKNTQDMKDSECPTQVSNGVKCVNFDGDIGVKCKSGTEMVANGNFVNCLGGSDNSNEKNLNSLGGITCAAGIDNALIDSHIKKEEVYNCSEVNGTDAYNTSKDKLDLSVEKGPSVKIIKDERKLNSCDQKLSSDNGSAGKSEKTKLKEHGSSSNTCHSSSSSSSSGKKGDEQSWSHHSSSSSSSSKYKYKDYKDYSHRSSSSSKNGSDRSKSSSDKSKYDSSDKKSRSCHHKPDEKCHCKSHHHSRHHSKAKKCSSVKTQCTADEIAYELRTNKVEISNPYFTRVPWVPHPQIANLKYGRFYRIEIDRNGGASICHLYMDEINHLSDSQMKECAIEFIKLSYSEDENECAYHVMGIVHGAAAYLPDLVDYMADHYPSLTVKTGSLASRDNHTTTMSQYRDEVYKTYSNGTFRYAPLDQLSICGVLGEEVGAYFPDFVARLEQSPFMKPVMPWSSLSVVETDNPRESNDGPIFWVRPGEQMLPANEALKESARPKKRRNNELDNLAYIAGSRSSEARESLFMDRTKAHADQVGVDYGLSNTAPTAAVGVLKSVNCGHPEHGNRATKDVVAFHAQDYNELLEILMLDLYEPPQTQCTKWIEVSKLNTLRREGIRYAHVQLHDNDVYYLPRKIIHQFQTISSVASVAWHIRYKDYFSIMGAPNLHTPTGINKGQVFYEKKNVAVYYPPVCENDLLASVTNPGSPLSKTPKKYEKLKDYSPFKHSPRKNHKVSHSPRTSSKKEKGSDPAVPHTPNKKEPDSSAGAEDKKSNSVKKDHGKSDDSHSKRDRESSSSKKSSSDGSNGHSSAKKERKEGHESVGSGHRKEVKNLETEFDSKKEKTTVSAKSPSKSKSSGHDERRRSDDKSESRHKRHDESKSKSHSKHDKNPSTSSSHKKTGSSSQVSNGSLVENAVKSDDRSGSSLKRRNSDSQDSCSSKRMKEDARSRDPSAEAGGCVRESSNRNRGEESDDACVMSNSQLFNSDSNAVGGRTLPDSPGSKDNAGSAAFDRCETNEYDSADIGVSEVSDAKQVDLRRSASPLGELPMDAAPPLPCISPPLNPPLPPNSPTAMETSCADETNDAPSSHGCPTVNHEESQQSVSLSGPQQNRDPAEQQQQHSKDKTAVTGGDPLQAKKIKKKIVKKTESDSYDLLGDIMSQMDKKK